jgi:hypothetical protein
MGAMNEKAPRPHRLEASKQVRHLVALFREAKGCGARSSSDAAATSVRSASSSGSPAEIASISHALPPPGQRSSLSNAVDAASPVSKLSAIRSATARAALVADKAQPMRGVCWAAGLGACPHPHLAGSRRRLSRRAGEGALTVPCVSRKPRPQLHR